MEEYAQHAALGVGNKSRTEVESDEENPTIPELTKDLDKISLDEVPDGEIEDLLKYEYATDISDVQDITLTEKGDVKAPEDTTSYTDLIALTEHDPSTVDPDTLAIEQLRKDAVNGELSAVMDSQFGGDVVMDTINRAASEIQGDVGVQKEKLFREAVAHATEMADNRKEAAQYAGDYVLKVSNDSSMSLKARKEAMGGFDKSRQYVESHSEAPEDVNVKESSNGALYYDSNDRGRGNIEATGPVDNTLLDMTRDELDKGMDVDVDDPDESLNDALASVSVAKAISSHFDVSHSRADNFVTEANQRGLTDPERIVRSAGVLFSKQDEITEGDVYYDQNDEEEIVVTEVDGEDVMVSSGDASWEESVEHITNLTDTGDWVHLPDEERSVETVDVDEKQDDDPCWEGYEMAGMKEQDGEMVPNCVPVDGEKSDKQDDDPCWEGYEMAGMKEQDGEMVPNCVPVDGEKSEKQSDIDHDIVYDVVASAYDITPDEAEDVLHDAVDITDEEEEEILEEQDVMDVEEWEEGDMVQWQSTPEKVGEVVHNPDDEDTVMVEVYDDENGELEPTGHTESVGPGDIVDMEKSESVLSRAISRGVNATLSDFRQSPQKTEKGRVYVDHPSDVPDQYELRTGLSEGVYYYETDDSVETETTANDEYDLGSSIFDAGDEVIIETEDEREIRGKVLEHNPDYEEMVVENKDGEELSVDTSEVVDIRQPSTEESQFENAVKRGISQALSD